MYRVPPSLARIAALACLLGPALVLPPARAAEKPAFNAGFFKALPVRSIGPANMSGRITDLAVVESRPSTLYVASASGGLWKTTNNGTTWSPVFDKETTVSLGAVAVAPSNPDVVWVGTGEGNPRNSVSWGDGVYKSTDGGRTWTNMGLRDSQHVGRIVVHPTNPDIVYVAALGHVWGPNRERGLYKTEDGGRTWKRSKFINQDTGFIDLVMDPSDSNVLYAAAWQVRRDGFSGGNPAIGVGPGSGLFRTADGGQTWERMTEGLPDRPLGRCGLSVYRKDPNVVYAVVQTDKTPTTVQGQPPNLEKIPGAKGKPGKGKISPDYGGVFRSDDKGKTWKWVNSLCPRPFYYGQIRVDPSDANRVYVLGIAAYASTNGGKTFRTDSFAKGTHPDYHALWIDPRDPDHLVLGCDGGLNLSYDRGFTWQYLRNLPVSQFYALGLDTRRPYRVYGGLQDNGSWGAPSATGDVAGITFADWFNIFGADGFHCQVDQTDPDTVYCEGQYGNLQRVNVATGATKSIKPRLPGEGKGAKQGSNLRPPPAKGTPAFRFNWSSPILLSPHDQRTVYYGGNHVFRSTDRGDTWEIVSPDLTHGKPGPSADSGHTLTTLAESPLRAGLLYAGSDDGRVHVSRDGGKSWTDLSAKVPAPGPERWVTRLVCSAFAEGTAYLSIDRHRQDDRRPYVFRTTDFGATWTPLMSNLPPDGPVHVIRDDPRNPDLLYAGTEFGLFVSADRGGSWQPQRSGLPTVAVHDVAVQARDQELAIATHGRGIYIMDVAPLQGLTPKVLESAAYLFDVKPASARGLRYFRSWAGTETYAGTNPPQGAVLYYYLKEGQKEGPTLTITNQAGAKVAQLKLGPAGGVAGLHRVVWEPRPAFKKGAGPMPPRVVPGEYTAVLQVGERTLRKRVRIEAE